MDEYQARETVVRAGIELIKSGLIVRTWGNISCRIDDTRFAITPSGRAYETLKPEDIVICTIADGKIADASRTGKIKPSSEKGVHALIYRISGEAGIVIHTHQRFASAVASSGVSIIQDEKMGIIPVAAYSLPGTKKMMRSIEAVLTQAKGAILMSNHGALCYGKDYSETFSTAYALEESCKSFMFDSYMKTSGAESFNKQQILDYYFKKVTRDKYSTDQRSGTVPSTQTSVFTIKKSRRDGSGIIASTALLDGTTDGETSYSKSTSPMPDEARMHLAIYSSRPEINNIEFSDNEYVVAASLAGKPLYPLLDDFAQMMGKPMCIAAPDEIVKVLGKAGGILIPGAGALCCAATESDAHALCLVTEKNALAEICAAIVGKPKPLSFFDCFLMHLVYTKKYAKKQRV